MNADVFRNNIRYLRKRRNRTQDDVANALGIKRSTFSGYENGVAEPSVSNIMQFSDYFGVAIDTLLKVNLSNLRESQISQLERGHDVYIKGSSLRVLATTVDRDNNENIELVSVKAKAGYATGFADPEFIKELPVFALPFLSRQKKYRTFQIKGDSMLPIPENAWVTSEFIQDWSLVNTGFAHIVVTVDDGVVFKVIENKLKETGQLMLHSLNPDYKPYPIDIDSVKELWKFVHFISSELPDYTQSHDYLIHTINHLEDELVKFKKSLARK